MRLVASCVIAFTGLARFVFRYIFVPIGPGSTGFQYESASDFAARYMLSALNAECNVAPSV